MKCVKQIALCSSGIIIIKRWFSSLISRTRDRYIYNFLHLISDHSNTSPQCTDTIQHFFLIWNACPTQIHVFYGMYYQNKLTHLNASTLIFCCFKCCYIKLLLNWAILLAVKKHIKNLSLNQWQFHISQRFFLMCGSKVISPALISKLDLYLLQQCCYRNFRWTCEHGTLRQIRAVERDMNACTERKVRVIK